jgi:hypothetical protein
MNVLDENIVASQRVLLQSWRIHSRQIGVEIGRSGMDDHDDIIPRLHKLRRPTFFTRDHNFYHPPLRHAGHCLVYLDVARLETAEYIRRFLRHPAFRTKTQRMGKVVRVRHSGLTYWQVGTASEHIIGWK